jgi:hypothetical protein
MAPPQDEVSPEAPQYTVFHPSEVELADTHCTSRRSDRSAKLEANFSGQIQEVVTCGFSEWQLVVR